MEPFNNSSNSTSNTIKNNTMKSDTGGMNRDPALQGRENNGSATNEKQQVFSADDSPTDDSSVGNNGKKSAEADAAIDVKLCTFPMKVHDMLSKEKEYGHIIGWQPHGRSFKVHDPDQFEKIIIPKYFNQTKYSSFKRQINGWGFRRITSGLDRDSYYHENFLRGRPQLCLNMKRPKRKAAFDPFAHLHGQKDVANASRHSSSDVLHPSNGTAVTSLGGGIGGIEPTPTFPVQNGGTIGGPNVFLNNGVHGLNSTYSIGANQLGASHLGASQLLLQHQQQQQPSVYANQLAQITKNNTGLLQQIQQQPQLTSELLAQYQNHLGGLNPSNITSGLNNGGHNSFVQNTIAQIDQLQHRRTLIEQQLQNSLNAAAATINRQEQSDKQAEAQN